MNRFSRSQIRSIIVIGFALSVLASCITFINDYNSLGYPNSFHGIFDSLLNPLATIAALIAWAMLTRLDARDDHQLRILRLAYLFFAAQYLLYAAGYNFIFTPIHTFGLWPTTYLWLNFAGVLVSAFGFFLMARSLVTVEEIERPMVARP
jgi:drug/metabolite transporter (DMT)-like permease